jgi:hypothetical protein
MGKYYQVHWFKLEKSLLPQELLCAAMAVGKTWGTYWLHKQNCFFFAAAIIEALSAGCSHPTHRSNPGAPQMRHRSSTSRPGHRVLDLPPTF